MKKNLTLFFFFFQSILFASAQINTFQRFSNRYFVESGSYHGDGIKLAIGAGFENIYSIELNHSLYQECKGKFANQPNVTLFQGDSGILLYDVIKNIDEPITFWLDGHYMGGNDTSLGEDYSPLLKELNAIKKHHIKNHTILIDDVRQFGTIWFNFLSLDTIIAKILEINPSYKIFFVDGYVRNDILIAQVQ